LIELNTIPKFKETILKLEGQISSLVSKNETLSSISLDIKSF